MSVELDPAKPTTPATDAARVAAPPVEAPAQAAPGSEAPKLQSADELWDIAQKEKTEKAPASAAVAAPDQKAATSPTAAAPAPPTPPTDGSAEKPDENDPAFLKAELAKERAKNQEIEQANQVAEVKKLAEKVQTELAMDRRKAERTRDAYDRKYAQVTQLEQDIAAARAEGDYETVEEKAAQYNIAYEEAEVLATDRDERFRNLDAKTDYYKNQYAKSREQENHQTLEQILKPYGKSAKEVLEKIPAEFKNNAFAWTDYALKEVVTPLLKANAELEKRLADTETRVNAQKRGKWDDTNPGSVPLIEPTSGGAGMTPVRATDKDADYWWQQAQREKSRAS